MRDVAYDAMQIGQLNQHEYGIRLKPMLPGRIHLLRHSFPVGRIFLSECLKTLLGGRVVPDLKLCG